MYEQFNSKQLFNLSKQFSDTAFKAHSLAIAGFERAIDLQIKTFENRMTAATDFWGEASEVRDIESARALMPKTINLAKDSAERMYAVSQELVGLTVKTNEAIGDLFKSSIEATNEAVKPVVSKKVSK